jgi:hypothetical protein
MIKFLESFVYITGFCALASCTPPSPEQLANETCDCFKETKAKQNTDNAIEAAVKCSGVAEMNMRRLRQIEREQDMTNEQVQEFEERFNKVYNNCK